MSTLDDDLEAAEHASCKLLDDEVPPWTIGGLRWGFPANPIPRMSIVVVAGLCFRRIVVHLEDDLGNRAFLVQGKLADRVRQPLHSWVTSNRVAIEQSWIKIMISRGWLTFYCNGKTLEVRAYEGHETMIIRTVTFTKLLWTGRADGSDFGSTPFY